MPSSTATNRLFMSPARRAVCGSAAVVLLLGLALAGQPTASADDLQVLFIGNSFTFYHELPAMVAELAKAAGQRSLLYQSETPGGFTLEQHWNGRKALEAIQSRHWDFVVLQDQSQAPLLRRDSMFEYGRRFDAEIKKQGARTILYETWAVRGKPEQQRPISKRIRGYQRN